jgi:hypothetical protein
MVSFEGSVSVNEVAVVVRYPSEGSVWSVESLRLKLNVG